MATQKDTLILTRADASEVIQKMFRAQDALERGYRPAAKIEVTHTIILLRKMADSLEKRFPL